MVEAAHDNWQRFWTDLPVDPGTAIWDSAPEVTAQHQLPLFVEHFPADLPVLDIGCGSGTQTAFLAGTYATVLGLDFAAAAVDNATHNHGASGARFRRFDLTDTAAARALHDELGDVSIYMRGVLHQMPEAARPAAAASLRVLLGERGRLFAVELAPQAGQEIQAALGQSADAVPKLRRVFAYGLTPASWPEGELGRVLAAASIDVVDSGSTPLQATELLPDGERLVLTMNYAVGAGR